MAWTLPLRRTSVEDRFTNSEWWKLMDMYSCLCIWCFAYCKLQQALYGVQLWSTLVAFLMLWTTYHLADVITSVRILRSGTISSIPLILEVVLYWQLFWRKINRWCVLERRKGEFISHHCDQNRHYLHLKFINKQPSVGRCGGVRLRSMQHTVIISAYLRIALCSTVDCIFGNNLLSGSPVYPFTDFFVTQ